MSDLEHTPDSSFGTVKWFDPSKGFGFVISDQGGADILLHVNVLRNFGQSSIADGARVELSAHETEPRRPGDASSRNTPSGNQPIRCLGEIVGVDPAIVAAAPIEPARVKWFDKSKGFGFANVFGKSDDVFLHIEVLRQSGLSDLQPGEALALRVINGERGKMAAEVRAWETVILNCEKAI